MKYIIMLLGSPNDETGKLSQIAMNRIECAYNLYANNEHMFFLCTGGFGEHFNITNQPHASYAQSTLIEKGVREEDFLPFTLSSNTYEDFLLSKDVIEKEAPDMLIVVTSDFHIDRARILQSRIINYPHVIFIPAQSTLSDEELRPLIQHEQNALRKLKEKS